MKKIIMILTIIFILLLTSCSLEIKSGDLKLWDKAKETGNLDYCYKIDNDGTKPACMGDVAGITKNRSICDLIPKLPEYDKNKYGIELDYNISEQRLGEKDMCLMKVGKSTINESICDEIRNIRMGPANKAECYINVALNKLENKEKIRQICDKLSLVYNSNGLEEDCYELAIKNNENCVFPNLILNGLTNFSERNFTKNVGNCSDTDGGLNYYVYGETEGINLNGIVIHDATDFCENNNTLIEYYCDEQGLFSNNKFKCPNGCQLGVCVKERLNLTKGCYDTDNGMQPYIKAKLVYYDDTYFLSEYFDNCDNNDLIEGVCNKNSDEEENYERIECPYGCDNGACVNNS